MTCPHCAEAIKPEACVCPHCRKLQPAAVAQRKAAVFAAIGFTFFASVPASAIAYFGYQDGAFALAHERLLSDVDLHGDLLGLGEEGYDSLIAEIALKTHISRTDAARFIDRMVRAKVKPDELKRRAGIRVYG